MIDAIKLLKEYEKMIKELQKFVEKKLSKKLKVEVKLVSITEKDLK